MVESTGAKRDDKGHFLPAKKRGAGRPAGKKDSAPRKFTHERFKKKRHAVSSARSRPVVPVTIPVVPLQISPEKVGGLASKSDTEIFGHGSPPKPKESAASGDAFSPSSSAPPLESAGPVPGQENKASEQDPLSAAEADNLASMVWGMELNIAGTVFGAEMLPRRYVDPKERVADLRAGEIPFDESEMVRGAWRDYLISLGLVVLSPLKKLWLAHAFYFVPRTGFILNKIKARFSRKKPVASNGEKRAGKATEQESAKAEREKKDRPSEQSANEQDYTTVQAKPESNVHDTESMR